MMKLINKQFFSLSVLVAACVTAPLIHAHSFWIKPSHTSLSGKKPTSVVIDASVSNDMFHADMAFGGKPKGKVHPRLQKLNAISTLKASYPDGKTFTPELINLSRKTVAEVPIQVSGTVLVAMEIQPRTFTRYVSADGQKKMAMTVADVPGDAKQVKVMSSLTKVQTFVTNNETSDISTYQTNNGLELMGGTHPNDVFEGEKATFVLGINGQPASGVEVKIIPANTRHRNNRNEIDVKTNAKGEFSVTWPQAGYYLLEASKKVSVDATHEKGYQLYLTLEVMPE